MFGTIGQHGNTNQNHNETVRYHFIPTKMAMIKKQTSVGEDVEKLKPSYTAGGKVKWYGHFGSILKFLKNLSKELPHNSVIPVLLVIFPREVSHVST